MTRLGFWALLLTCHSMVGQEAIAPKSWYFPVTAEVRFQIETEFPEVGRSFREGLYYTAQTVATSGPQRLTEVITFQVPSLEGWNDQEDALLGYKADGYPKVRELWLRLIQSRRAFLLGRKVDEKWIPNRFMAIPAFFLPVQDGAIALSGSRRLFRIHSDRTVPGHLWESIKVCVRRSRDDGSLKPILFYNPKVDQLLVAAEREKRDAPTVDIISIDLKTDTVTTLFKNAGGFVYLGREGRLFIKRSDENSAPKFFSIGPDGSNKPIKDFDDPPVQLDLLIYSN